MTNREKSVGFSPAEIAALPETSGVFWIESDGEILFARLAENLRRAATRFLEAKRGILNRFPAERTRIFFAAPPDLLNFYSEMLTRRRPRFDFVLAAESNLPFLILTTGERFPRVLATRRPENAFARGDAIYGAFAPRTGVRFLLDFVQRLFKLHPCELDIKGDFAAPCPEYFLGHCLAPCVAGICDDRSYAEAVEMAHLFLAGRGADLLEKIDAKIEILARDLEFERAAGWRDARRTIGEVLRSEKWKLNASAMSDVLSVERDENTLAVFATTLRRGRQAAQNRFERSEDFAVAAEGEILAAFIAQYYRYFAPKRIFVPADFPERRFLEKLLAEKFGGRLKIVAEDADALPPSVQTARKLSAAAFDYRSSPDRAPGAALKELEKMFDLAAPPRRVECFDVAHLAGENIIAGRVVAINGETVKEEEIVWEFKNLSETDALAAAVAERLRLIPDEKALPDLIVLDGARAQINAVEKILRRFDHSPPPVIGVVKPPGRHNGVSHFLSNRSNEKIGFDARSPAALFLQKLRDAAHSLANRTHRQTRSLARIFEERADGAPQVQYLLVPVRFAERFGAADDLSPLRSLSQSGCLLFKSKGGKNEM